MRTGIPPSVWADEGERAIRTAFHLLNQGRSEAEDEDGRQMSG